MEIKGITSDDFAEIVHRVSRAQYDGNITVNDPRPAPMNRWGLRFRQRVIATSSCGAGARRSASGRRMPCACWHVFRDVVRATLVQVPAATFRMSLAYYTSDNFESTYPATGYVNVGSMFAPATLPELCECNDVDNGRPAERAPERMPVPRQTPVAMRPTPKVWAAERDQVLAIAAHECAWCGGVTEGDVFAWCGQECQGLWQDKYGAGLARTVPSA
jgi:hypothetical protein